MCWLLLFRYCVIYNISFLFQNHISRDISKMQKSSKINRGYCTSALPWRRGWDSGERYKGVLLGEGGRDVPFQLTARTLVLNLQRQHIWYKTLPNNPVIAYSLWLLEYGIGILWCSNPGMGKRYFSLPKHTDGLWGPTNLVLSGCRTSFFGTKRPMYETLYCPTNAHNHKILRLLKLLKL